jgi:transcription elongation GreA/GreB family factor
MADAVEAIGQAVEQEAPDELVGVERHDLRLVVMTIVLPAEADPAIGQADQAGVGDGDAVRVAAEIRQHLFGAAEGRLRVDYPLGLTALGQRTGEGVRFGEPREIADEVEITGLERGSVRSCPAQETASPWAGPAASRSAGSAAVAPTA